VRVQWTQQSHFLDFSPFLLCQHVCYNCVKNNKVWEKVRALRDTDRSHKVITPSVKSLGVRSTLLPLYLKERKGA